MKRRQDMVLELLDRHGGVLHRLLGRLTRCEHATSDLMQELFIKLSNSKGTDRARNLYAYAWTTATNLAFDWRRKQKVKLYPLDDDDRPDESGPTALGRMIRDEQLELILDATSKLNELARNVVVMRFIEQQSYDQIALQLGKNPNYLRALCSRSLVRLREILVECDDTDSDRGISYG